MSKFFLPQKLKTSTINYQFKIAQLLFYSAILVLTSCSSYEKFKSITEDVEIPSQVYRHDYNRVWNEVLKVSKNYEAESFSQEAGIIKTRWKDNTQEMNFADSFGTSDAVKAAQFKLIINVVKGFRGNKEVTKVSIFKRQKVEQDFLQGWKVIRSDGILEKSILYRLEKSLEIEAKLQAIDEMKAKEAEKNF